MTTREDAIKRREALLRAAVQESMRLSESDPFGLQSVVGLARSERDRVVVREETAPSQALLDIHLDGESVVGHMTKARALARFIERIAEATKETAKHIDGMTAHSSNLLVEGFSPGSVRIRLRAPESKADIDMRSGRALVAPSSSADSKALRRIAQVMTLASTEDLPAIDDEDPLLGAVHALPTKARGHLRSAMTEVTEARWEIHGSLQQFRTPEASVSVTQRGAERLRSALKFNPGEPSTEVLVGVLDGFKWSEAIAYFKAEGRGRTYRVAILDDELLTRVARLAERRSRAVSVTIESQIEQLTENQPARVTRTMLEITDLEPTPPPRSAALKSANQGEFQLGTWTE